MHQKAKLHPNALKNPYVPGQSTPITGGGGIWLQPPTAQCRTLRGRKARMRPAAVNMPSQSYPDLMRLGWMVFRQAITDAEPDRTFDELGNHRGNRVRLSITRLREQHQALLWLTEQGPDSDLAYWADVCHLDVHCIQHKYEPILAKFRSEHGHFA